MMNEMSTAKIKALVSLLDDSDQLVYNNVRTELFNLVESIPELQVALESSRNELKAERIVEILDHLKFEKLDASITAWNKKEHPELIDGMLAIARYGYPNFDGVKIIDQIDEIVDAVRSKQEGKSTREMVDVLNQIILYDFGFNGNLKEYNNLYNSFINKVLELKVSNPIGLSIIYLLVAKELNLPMVGINSPGHFVLGFLNEGDDTNEETLERIDFFVDPFNNGRIIEKQEFISWLKSKDRGEERHEMLIANDRMIIKRVFNNLIYSLFTSGEKLTAEKLLPLAESIELNL